MENLPEYRIGNDTVFIAIGLRRLDSGKAAVQSALQVGRNGRVGRQLIRRVVDPKTVKAEVEQQIGRAWHWLRVNGVELSHEASLRSVEAARDLMKRAKDLLEAT